MSTNKVWLHAGQPCHGCGGIGEMWARLDAAGVPFAVYSVENGGLIAQASAYPGATLVYRTLATDVAPYHLTPAAAANQQWAIAVDRLPPEVRALKGRVWYEIGNEQDKGRADWLGHYYAELAALALRDGYRLAGPGWSTGEPEPEHWQTPGWLRYLRLCAQHPERLAVTVHEYSLNADDIMDGSPWLVGRVKFLFDVCNANGIHPPTVFVTEAGWTHNDLPYADKARADIDALARLYAEYPTVKAAFLWTVIGGGDKTELAAELNALIPWLADYAIATRFPDVELPGTPAPVTNLLVNGSFEDGWTDATTFPGQHPNGWTVGWNTGANPIVLSQPYQVGEGVHKSKARNELPPEEWDLFILDGDECYKAFADRKPIWFRMKQVLQLKAGKYKLITPVVVDCYRGRAENKDFTLEPNHAQARVKVNDKVVRDWTNLPAGTTQRIETVIDHPGGVLDLAVHFRANWGTSNNFFLDDWSMTAVTEAPPPPPPPPPPVNEKPVLVLDISRHQVVINPPKMKAAGVDAVILRASYGGRLGSKTDEKVHDFAPKLQAAGIPISFYHLLHSKQPVDVQFNLFRAVVEKYGFSFPLALDLEEHAGGDDSLMAAKAAEFVALMDEHFPLSDGRRHMVYTSVGYMPKIGNPAWVSRYDLWLAQWNTASKPSLPYRWDNWRLWQYSSSGDGAAYGVGSARVDLNRFNGNRADFAAWLVDGQPAPSFDERMMALGQASRLVTRHPQFALEQAMIRDGFAPVGAEMRGRVDEAGPVYAYQLAASLDGTKERTYFAFDGDWGGVEWTDGAGGVPPVVQPPPVVEQPMMIDTLPYIRGQHRRQFDMGHNVNGGGTQTVQVWHLSEKDWLYIKGENGEYERLGLRLWQGQEWIFRFDDTSESETRFYAHYLSNGGAIGAPWFPRYAEVGKWYETSKHVQHYLKAGCAKQNGGPVTDRLRLVSGPRAVTYAESLARLDDVITLEWSGGELYDFARDRGNVAFRNDDRRFWFIGDLQGRDDKRYNKPSCIPLGW